MNLNTNSTVGLVAQIEALSGTDKELAQLNGLLKQSEELLKSDSTRLAPLLHELDPSKYSLGYLYILEACTSKGRSNDLAPCIARFIDACSANQIRLEPDKFVSVCRRLKDLVMSVEAPIRGVAPMLRAVRKLQSSPEHLTTLHPEILLLSLLAKCYKTGFSLLEDNIYEVDQPRDFFLYCYYGGMICIGQKQFRKASELLHNVVTAPMLSLNAIALEAFKKYILVSLIHFGQFSVSLPKYSSSVAQRSMKNYSQPYLDLAGCYGTGKVSELESFIQTNKEKFQSDNNLGLVKQVVSSMYKHNIQRLTQTYLTLSLQDIANSVHLKSSKEAEMHVLQMIQDGEIYATINQKDGMVRFLEDPEQYKTCQMLEHIDSSIQRTMALSKKLTAMDEHMSCDPLYLAKVGRERHRFDSDDFDGVPSKFNVS